MIRSFSTSIDGKTRICFLKDDIKLGRILGSVTIETDLANHIGYFYELYVDPDFRREGIATSLIKQGIKELQIDLSISNFSCNIKNKNQASMTLFQKIGFRRSLVNEEDHSYYFSLHF